MLHWRRHVNRCYIFSLHWRQRQSLVRIKPCQAVVSWLAVAAAGGIFISTRNYNYLKEDGILRSEHGSSKHGTSLVKQMSRRLSRTIKCKLADEKISIISKQTAVAGSWRGELLRMPGGGRWQWSTRTRWRPPSLRWTPTWTWVSPMKGSCLLAWGKPETRHFYLMYRYVYT